jgi:osmotically-inducible protein OsmY
MLFALPVFAATPPQTTDLTPQFEPAELRVHNLRAVEVGGIVLLRGDTDDPAQAVAATTYAQSLGYYRVANLIRVVDHPNDDQIERIAERKLATRTLDGCSFRVQSNRGVVTIDGKVRYELQKDLALALVRNIDGVREVRSAISK